MDDFKPVGGGPWTATVMVSGENHQVAIERLRDLLVVIDMAVDTQTINPTDPTTESRAVISTPNSRFDESPHFWCPSKGPPMALHSVLLHLRDRLCNVNRPGGRKIRTYVDRIRTYVRKIHLRYKALRDPRISTADMLSPLLRFGEREMIAGKRVLITGGVGFLGTHLCPAIKDRAPYDVDLPRKRYRGFIDPQRTKSHFESAKLEIVIHLAVRARGIGDNRSSPSRFFYENAIMGINVMEEARRAHVERFVNIGTICSYPKFTPVPFKEEDIWNGYPEETNAPYGIAKKALMVMGQAYRQQYGMNAITLLPVNMYGPGDNFDPASSQVIPAIPANIRKVISAREGRQSHIEAWGTGTASREFLFVRDAAEGIARATESYDEGEPINLDSGMEITIKDLTELICDLCNYSGKIHWDTTKPDGQPRRLLDSSKAQAKLGFSAPTDFRTGLRETIGWYEGVRGQQERGM